MRQVPNDIEHVASPPSAAATMKESRLSHSQAEDRLPGLATGSLTQWYVLWAGIPIGLISGWLVAGLGPHPTWQPVDIAAGQDCRAVSKPRPD